MGDYVIHAADPPEEAGLVIAACGAVGYILPDATLTPDTFNFAAPWSPVVDCLDCLGKLQTRDKRTSATRRVGAAA